MSDPLIPFPVDSEQSTLSEAGWLRRCCNRCRHWCVTCAGKVRRVWVHWILCAPEAVVCRMSSTDTICDLCRNNTPPNGEPDAEGHDHRRSESVKSWAARGIVGTVLALSVVTISSVLTVAFHALLPARFHYLDPQQLETLKTFLAVMLVSSLLSDYARRLIDR